MTSSVVTQSPQDRTDILVLLLRKRRSSGLAEAPRQRAAGTTAFFAPHQATYPPTRPHHTPPHTHTHPHHTPRLLLILGRDIFMTELKNRNTKITEFESKFYWTRNSNIYAVYILLYELQCLSCPCAY